MSSDAADRLSEYVSRLLGRDVRPGERVALTSGQFARVIGWAESLAIQLDPKNGNRHSFLVATADGDASAKPSAPVSQRGRGGAPASSSHRNVTSIGVDLQLIDEVIPPFTDLKALPELRNLFSLRELSYAECRPNPRETLCGLFAAKEAIKKADSQYLGSPFSSMEILPDSEGRPEFPGVALSISHSGGYAMAVAVVNGKGIGGGAVEPPTPDRTAADHAVHRTARLRGAATLTYRAILLCGALALVALAADRFLPSSIF